MSKPQLLCLPFAGASAMRRHGLPPLPMRELYTHQKIRNLAAALA